MSGTEPVDSATPATPATTAAAALHRCAELDRFSASSTWLERTYLSREHASVNAVVGRWLEQAGLRTWTDAAGNQWGRREGRTPGLPALVLGSHTDTVPEAGSFDGMLGVIMAISVAQRLGSRIADFPFAVEIVGFSDEEGTRFGTALMGSRAVAGTWDDDWWDYRDRHGISVLTAFTEFGLDPKRVGAAARRPDDLIGYLEAHIEQGPYLEAADASLGVVTSIAGARRFRLSTIGEARHAGGTPYPRRKDALVAAGEAIVTIERLARETNVIATVGRIEVQPGAVNVIAGRADFSLDLRAEVDRDRDEMWDRMRIAIEKSCAARGVRFEVFEAHRAPAVRCARWLQRAVTDGIRTTGDDEPMPLWSRAGHDAMAIASVTDVGMLFLRCFDGISHHPKENVREIDVERGLDAFEQAVLNVARQVDA